MRPLSLWSLIETMQQRLEAEGLEKEVVDVAVTRGLLTLLRRPARGDEHAARRSLLTAFVPVQS
jgi:hypothetical protein